LHAAHHSNTAQSTSRGCETTQARRPTRSQTHRPALSGGTASRTAAHEQWRVPQTSHSPAWMRRAGCLAPRRETSGGRTQTVPRRRQCIAAAPHPPTVVILQQPAATAAERQGARQRDFPREQTPRWRTCVCELPHLGVQAAHTHTHKHITIVQTPQKKKARCRSASATPTPGNRLSAVGVEGGAAAPPRHRTARHPHAIHIQTTTTTAAAAAPLRLDGPPGLERKTPNRSLHQAAAVAPTRNT
jgi:hypothetical protein